MKRIIMVLGLAALCFSLSAMQAVKEDFFTADITTKDAEGNTALHRAVSNPHSVFQKIQEKN